MLLSQKIVLSIQKKKKFLFRHLEGEDEIFKKNIVYKEILISQRVTLSYFTCVSCPGQLKSLEA